MNVLNAINIGLTVKPIHRNHVFGMTVFYQFQRVKLSAKILFLFRISNKNNSFLFLLLIINKFGAHCISHKKALYPSWDIGLYEIHLLKRIIYRSLTSHDSCRGSGSEAPRSEGYGRGSTCC